MANPIKDNTRSALFRRVEGTVFSDGDYTYRNYYLDRDDLEDGDVLDVDRLKNRLFNRIINLNSERIKHYNLNVDDITPSTNLELKKFVIIKDGEKGSSGSFSLYPLEFICDKCGKYYNVKTSRELPNIPSYCPECGGKLKQNTIALFCPECGQFSSMNLYCSTHGNNKIYVQRPKRDNISTWTYGCRGCSSNQKITFRCGNCHKRAEPLTIRDGGLVNSVVYTYVDLPKISVEKDVDVIRYAIDNELITKEYLASILRINLDSIPLDQIIKQVCDAALNILVPPPDNILSAKQYIDNVKKTIQNSFSDDSIEYINDVKALIDSSISLKQQIQFLDEDYAKSLTQLIDDYNLFDIYYIENLRLVSSCVGVINGINKFYDPSYVPHFIPFKKKGDDSVYAITLPINTEGILFKLDPCKVYQWLLDNEYVSEELYGDESEQYILHLSSKSQQYEQIQILIHSFCHLLIKQSSIHTGLDDGSCSELLFPNSCSFLIYSTSTVNIGGFEYLFKHSMLDWFREIMYSVENCTFDPICKEEGGKCFSCMFLEEHVCCDFNHHLSRLSLIGGSSYKVGFWIKSE